MIEATVTRRGEIILDGEVYPAKWGRRYSGARNIGARQAFTLMIGRKIYHGVHSGSSPTVRLIREGQRREAMRKD
jgi:hypothetical protein